MKGLALLRTVLEPLRTPSLSAVLSSDDLERSRGIYLVMVRAWPALTVKLPSAANGG